MEVPLVPFHALFVCDNFDQIPRAWSFVRSLHPRIRLRFFKHLASLPRMLVNSSLARWGSLNSYHRCDSFSWFLLSFFFFFFFFSFFCFFFLVCSCHQLVVIVGTKGSGPHSKCQLHRNNLAQGALAQSRHTRARTLSQTPHQPGHTRARAHARKRSKINLHKIKIFTKQDAR